MLISYFSYHKPIISCLKYDINDDESEQNLPEKFMQNYNYIHCKCYLFMNIEPKKIELRIMKLALTKFSLLPCVLKHTQFS